MLTFTDDTGFFQHAKYCIPIRSEGYTTDDNARALIAAVKYLKLKPNLQVKRLAHVYLAFLYHMQKQDGNLHNYLGYERLFHDIDGSEDCIGRTLWSTGCTINSGLPDGMRLVAKEIFDRGLPWARRTTQLRCYAFAVLGLREYGQAAPNSDIKENAGKLAENIVQRYEGEVKDNWRWFEPHLTYENARLPQALFVAYSMVHNRKLLDVAKESLDFLLKTTMVDGMFVPVGNDGWYKRGENRAVYDQQPLEATAMVDAAIDAYNVTGDRRYLRAAKTAFAWFLGKNTNKMPVYDPETSGCHDGISGECINKNQGGESSVSYLLARLRLEEVKQRFWR